MFMQTLAAGAALLASADAAAAAGGVTAEEALRTRTVIYRPSDIADAAGRAALVEDIRTAARTVCREHGGNGLRNARQERTCFDRAMEQALAQLEDQAVRDGRSGGLLQLTLRETVE